MNASRRANLTELAGRLREAERGVRILRTLAWPAQAKQRFFDAGCRELPAIPPVPFDAKEVLSATDDVRRLARGEDPALQWLTRIARDVATSARMLAAAGTPEFFEHSYELYGGPEAPLLDGKSTSLQLARIADRLWSEVSDIDLGASENTARSADEVAARIQAGVRRLFGEDAPEVVVVDELSANALAGPQAIRIRRGAAFTDRDAEQLTHHEAFVHVCTSLNGQAQDRLPILGAGHAGTTRTQEGLAVLAEYLSGSMDPDRLRRLADRVLAIQMAIDGADFLDVFGYFQERTGDDDQAFESARRVFRGGVLGGGAPFTKDVVYLDGLLRVTNFMRAAVAHGRSDLLLLLFCGKLDIEDVPALSMLSDEGLCRPPRYLPPWLEDRRFLVAYLAFSRFLGEVEIEPILRHYEELLTHCAAGLGSGQSRTRPRP